MAALEEVARQVGIVRRSGVLALHESGLGPRAAWRLWRQVKAGGGGVGAFVSLLVEWGSAVVDRVPAADGTHPPHDPCPLCASPVYPGAGWGECSRGHGLRLCSCGEWSPEEGACPWCGTLPGPGAAEPEPTEGPEPPNEAEQIWQAALVELQLVMTQATFNRLLRGTRVVACEDGVFVIGVRNDYAKDWLENRLAPTVCRILARLTKRTVEVRFVVAEG